MAFFVPSSNASAENCSIADCSSVRGSSTCSLSACEDSSLCRNVECCHDTNCQSFIPCQDQKCNHVENYFTYDSLAGRSMGEDIDSLKPVAEIPKVLESPDRFACQWLNTGQFCDVSPPSWDALGNHIFEDHIQPQTQQICHWNECNEPIDYQKLPCHLNDEHELGEYVCLWTGCRAPPFSSSYDLDSHIQSMHVKGLDCHWAGCDVVNNDPKDLTNHVLNEHLRPSIKANPSGWESQSRSDHSPSISCVKHHANQDQSPAHQNIASIYHTSKVAASADRSTPSSSSNVLGAVSNMAKAQECRWIVRTGNRYAICGSRIYGSENELQKHVEGLHTSAKPLGGYVCGWKDCCKGGKPFKDRFSLNRHLHKHTGFYLHMCKFCNKKFSARDHFENHQRMHEGEKPFQCDQCPSRFSNNESLTIHKRTHTGVKPFKCPECDYCCADSSNMSKHKKIHQRPVHFCSFCGQGFCRPSSLKRHMTIHGKTRGARASSSQKRASPENGKFERPEARLSRNQRSKSEDTP